MLKGEKNLLIISPYIDDYYAAFLARHSHGRKRYIISSSIRGSASKRLRRSDIGNPLVATFLAVSVNWLLFLLNEFNPALAIVSICFGFVLIAYSLARRSSIYLKVPKDFVHAKLYVGDSVAVEGSANLTYAGMHKNLESVRLITDRREVEALKRRFWTLWNSL